MRNICGKRNLLFECALKFPNLMNMKLGDFDNIIRHLLCSHNLFISLYWSWNNFRMSTWLIFCTYLERHYYYRIILCPLESVSYLRKFCDQTLKAQLAIFYAKVRSIFQFFSCNSILSSHFLFFLKIIVVSNLCNNMKTQLWVSGKTATHVLNLGNH